MDDSDIVDASPDQGRLELESEVADRFVTVKQLLVLLFQLWRQSRQVYLIVVAADARRPARLRLCRLTVTVRDSVYRCGFSFRFNNILPMTHGLERALAVVVERSLICSQLTATHIHRYNSAHRNVRI